MPTDTGTLQGSGRRIGERAFEVSFEFEIDWVELSMIVAHPLASPVMDSAGIFMEDRVLADVVHVSE